MKSERTAGMKWKLVEFDVSKVSSTECRVYLGGGGGGGPPPPPPPPPLQIDFLHLALYPR